MNAIATQLATEIAVVFRIKSFGKFKEYNVHWLKCTHKLCHPLLIEKGISQAGIVWDKAKLRV